MRNRPYQFVELINFSANLIDAAASQYLSWWAEEILLAADVDWLAALRILLPPISLHL